MRSCCAASARRSSPAPGSTAAAPTRSPSPGTLPRDGRRRRADSRHARPRGSPARVRQRLPPPRCGVDGRLREAQHAPVPLPRLDVRPRRLAASCAALRARAGFRPATIGRCYRRASTPGDRSSSSIRTRPRYRSPSSSASCRRSWHATIDIDAIEFHSRVEFGANANWKIVVENFLECYHCPTAHPSFSEEVDVHPDRYLLEAHPTFAAQFAEAKQTGERGQFHLLFPNTGLNVFPGPANLSIGPIAPAGPGRTERYLDYFFAPGLGCGVARASSSRSTTRSAARTRCSSSRCIAAWPPGWSSQGRLLLNAEPLLAAFQRWVGTQLGSA